MARKGFDVCVIGGGIFGLCAAYACAQHGLKVQLVEARHIGAGASGGLLGVMSPFSPDNWHSKKTFQLEALRSAEPFWAAIASESGEDPGYARVGRRIPLAKPAAREKAKMRVAAAANAWGGTYRMWIADAAPPLAPAAHGFLADDLSGRIHPRNALKALAAAARAAGVSIVEACPTSIEDAQTIAAKVIVAAGHECDELLPQVAACGRGVKGQAALFDMALPRDTPVIAADGFYLVAHPGAGIAVGATSEKEWHNASVTDGQLDILIEQARAALPALRGAPIIERWAGVRPRGRFPDPVVGPVPGMPDVWLMSGGYGIGFGIAHAIARALANAIAGAPLEVPPRFLPSAHEAKAKP